MLSGGVEVAPKDREGDGGAGEGEGSDAGGEADGEDDELVEMHTWASLVSEWSSCHGVVWYNRFYTGHLQKSAFALMLALMMGLPAIIIMELVTFVREVRLSDAVLTRRPRS